MTNKISSKRLKLIAVIFLFFTLCIFEESFAENLSVLFKKIEEPSAASRKTSLLNNDRIRISVNFSLIKPGSKRIKMKAYLPDKTIILKKSRTEQRYADNYTWFGNVEEKKLSSAVITVIGKSVYGYINIDGDEYSIKPYKNDYLVIKSDPEKMIPFDFAPKVPNIKKISEKVVAEQAVSEDGSQIDILVLYTQQMADTYGSNLNVMIQHFVDLSNQSYSNSSLTAPRLNLVHSELYNNANVAEGTTIDSALNYITSDSNIASKRDTYRADLVSLLRHFNPTESYCGLAWIMQTVSSSFSSYAYSVVGVRNASEGGSYCSELSFAHELGHNMGCAHNRENSSSQGAYPYSYGYHFTDSASGIAYGTVMSYIGKRITYFSNPNVNYTTPTNSSYPVGIAETQPNSANNAKTIDNTKVVISNFKISSTPTTTTTSTTVSTTTTTIPTTTTSTTTTSTTLTSTTLSTSSTSTTTTTTTVPKTTTTTSTIVSTTTTTILTTTTSTTTTSTTLSTSSTSTTTTTTTVPKTTTTTSTTSTTVSTTTTTTTTTMPTTTTSTTTTSTTLSTRSTSTTTTTVPKTTTTTSTTVSTTTTTTTTMIPTTTTSTTTTTVTTTTIACGNNIPVITNLTPTKVVYPNKITISGSDFCDQVGTVIFINGSTRVETSVSDIINWSDTEINVSIPWGCKAGINKVKVNTAYGNVSNAKSFKLIKLTPKITGTSLKAGHIGSEIVITGDNFGKLDNKSKVLFGNVEADTIYSWSNKNIVVAVPDINVGTKAKSVSIKVKTTYGTGNSKKFKIMN